MRTLTGLFTVIAVAAVTGLGLTAASVGRGTSATTIAMGAWTTTPRIGTPDIDPYSRALNARIGLLPLALGDGVTLIAEVDDTGRSLDPACTYRVRGPAPLSRYWTLAVSGKDFAVPADDLRRVFTSHEVVRLDNEVVDVVVAGAARAGNWLPTIGLPEVKLILRLYDTPLATTFQANTPLPSVTRVSCP
jgi:hypothetical protein